MNLIKVDIYNNESLKEACDYLHDAVFDLAAIQYDQVSGTWKGKFGREYFENPDLIKQETKFFIFKKTIFPMVDSDLTLTGIKSFEIQDKSQIGSYHFDSCEIVDTVITFFFCEDMEMIFEFNENPRGSLVDNKLLDKQSGIPFLNFRNPFRRKARDSNR